MKQLLYCMAMIFLITSCEDVIDVDLPNGTPKLVVDASYEVYFNTNNTIEIIGGVRLSLSAPFFNQEIPTVSNATVFITNLSTNTIFDLEESDQPGFYNISGGLIPEFDIDYELTVVYNNETYKAISQLTASVPIDRIEQGEGTLFDGNETEIIVSFTDDGARDDFYLFDFDFSLFLASEDRFYQGEKFNFSYFYEDQVSGKDITIKILGIDKQYFNYITLLIEQSEQDGGNPFQTPPAALRGNIINTTNPDNNALGYFNLSEANRTQFQVSE